MMNFARLGLLKLCLGIAYLAVASAAGSTGSTGAAWAATISKDDQYPFYEPDLVQYVASKGSFPVVVVANPFGAGKDGALLAGLELPSYYPPTPFIATTPQNSDDGHIVLVFAPITAANGYDTCRTPASQTITGQKGDTTNKTLRLQAAFCYDDEMVSEAFMEMPKPKGPHDQRLTLAIDQFLDILLPSQSPNIGTCSAGGGNC